MDQQPNVTPETETKAQWAIVDVMGHNRRIGILDEFTFAGFAFVRVRTPQRDGSLVPHLIGPGSVYEIHMTTEMHAMRLLGLYEEPQRMIEQRESFMLDADEDEEIDDDSEAQSSSDYLMWP